MMGLARISAVLIGIALVGCAGPQPIHNITNAPIAVEPRTTAATARDVATAILRAGSFLGWKMSEVGPGQIVGRLTLRQHFASIDIEYDARSYSIKYRDSENLDAGSGQIHPEYNRWIRNLDKAIQTELQAGRVP